MPVGVMTFVTADAPRINRCLLRMKLAGDLKRAIFYHVSVSVRCFRNAAPLHLKASSLSQVLLCLPPQLVCRFREASFKPGVCTLVESTIKLAETLVDVLPEIIFGEFGIRTTVLTTGLQKLPQIDSNPFENSVSIRLEVCSQEQ